MNLRLVAIVLGHLTLACGAAMFPPVILAVIFADPHGSSIFFLSMVFCLIVTFELERFGMKTRRKNLGVREGLAVTGLGWLLICLLGMIPYVAGGYLNLLDAFLESVSGFSGTGATVIEDVEILPWAVLLWRSLSNWLGGLGIIIIFVAILPQGRGAMNLVRAEATGPTNERQMPRIRDNAKAIFLVYVALTIFCSIVYWICGLEFFPAVNHAMTTIATGGFSTFNGSVADYGNIYLEIAMTFFMIVSSGSFAMYVVAWKKGSRVIFQNTEFNFYLRLIGVAAILIMLDLIFEGNFSIFNAVRFSIFHVASMASTTGFVSYDFDTFPPFAKGVLLMTMFLGGCAGSTAGGLKVSRIVLLAKLVYSIAWQKLHPRMIAQVKMNDRVVSDEILFGVAKFFFAYVMMDIILAFIMLLNGIPMIDAVSVSVSTIGSVGPGFGIQGAMSSYSLLPDASKIFVCIFMFLSRLEIFTVLVLFTPEFWRRQGW